MCEGCAKGVQRILNEPLHLLAENKTSIEYDVHIKWITALTDALQPERTNNPEKVIFHTQSIFEFSLFFCSLSTHALHS